MLYGSKSNPGGGALSGMLDPRKLNVTGPTGPQAAEYGKISQDLARQGQNAVGNIEGQSANRGFTMGSGAKNALETGARLTPTPHDRERSPI
jgi:hypothetical protein